MSAPTPQPLDAPFPPPAPEQATPRRRWIVLVAVAVGALLIGAVGATAAILVFGEDEASRHRYQVTVFLDHDITAEQKGAVESALAALHPVDGVRFETREQAWQRFREMFKEEPDLLGGTKAEHLPESFGLATTGEVFDCAALASVRQLPGVAEITVVQLPAGSGPGAVIKCP